MWKILNEVQVVIMKSHSTSTTTVEITSYVIKVTKQ